MNTRSTFLLLLMCLFLNTPLIAQYKLTLQPNAEEGMVCGIFSHLPNESFDYYEDFEASAWTARGKKAVVRTLINFNLSEIPDNAIIEKAYLSLYTIYSFSTGYHTSSGGSNECLLQLIKSDWDHKTVNWASQPSTTTEDQVILIESVAYNEDYEDIDVTTFIQKMKFDPENNFGFMMKLRTEKPYRRMHFASSNCPNEKYHPKLEVFYSLR